MIATEFIPSRERPAEIVAHCFVRSGLFVTVHVVANHDSARRVFSMTYTWPGKGALIKIHDTVPMLIPGNVTDLCATIAIEEFSK